MYELILHSQVASSRHSQVLHILAGVTALQPSKISEQTLIYQQLKPTQAVAASKKGAPAQPATAQRLRYHKLVREIRDGAASGAWNWVVEETPDAGIKDVNARNVAESFLETEGLQRFEADAGGYKYVLSLSHSITLAH